MISRVALCLATCLIAAPAVAQIVPCPAISNTQNYKLVLDDFSLVGGNEPTLDVFMESVRARLRMNLLALGADTPDGGTDAPLNVELVRCIKRRPKAESDFDKNRVSALNSHRVIIEMWAIGSLTPGASKSQYRAFVNYALIPVRHLVAGQVPDVVTVELKGSAGEPLEGLLDALDQSVELSAYVAATLGTKLLQERDYDRARAYLCKADEKLSAARSPAPPPTLVQWVRDLSIKVFEQALKDAAYRGAMRLFEGQSPPACGK